jgi:transketolase
VETAEAWEIAVTQKATPSVLSLTRQDVPQVRLEASGENLTARGAYELRAAESGPALVTLIGTGSEVSLALEAQALLAQEGIAARVVSMPSWELFEAQDEAYRRDVLQPGTVRIAVEAAVGLGWERWMGEDGGFVGMPGFGASAPYKELYDHFGITPRAVADLAKTKLSARDARTGVSAGV